MGSRAERGWWVKGLLAGALTLAVLCAEARAQGVARLENVDADPEMEIVAENAFYRIVVKPSQSGAAVSLKVKPKGTEMAISTGGRGLMTDAVWQQGNTGDWHDAYSSRIEENTPQQARIVLEKRGRTGDVLQWISIRRTLTLRADSPVIDVKVELMNEDASMQAFRLGLWQHNQVGAEKQEVAYFVPLETGVQRRTVSGGVGTQEMRDYNVSRGWMAALAEDGCGLGFRVDYSRLMCFYQWLKSSNRTMEWLYRSEEIPNGGSFQTSYQIIPFTDLPYVDGVGDGVVGAIVFEKQPLPGQATRGWVELTGGPGDVEAVIEWGLAPEMAWKEIGRGTCKLGAGVGKVGFEWVLGGEGTYALRARLSRGGNPCGLLERAVPLGKTSGQYAMAPECERKGDLKERMAQSLPLPKQEGKAQKKIELRDAPPDIPYSMGVFSPHVAWARPYHMGPVKALVTTQTQVGREIIEMAQRVDLDLKTVTLGASGWKLPGDLVKGWNPQAAMMNLRLILQKQDLDVIALRMPWSALDKDCQDLIRKRVEAGVGLVYVSFDSRDDDAALFEMMGQGGAEKSKPFGGPEAAWKALGPHYIAGALPYDMIRTPVYSFAPGKSRPVLAWRNGKEDVPMVVVGQYGKGRVVCVNYNSTDFNARIDQFTPAYLYRPFGGNTMPDYDAAWPRHHWREYAWAMLCRCVLWAGNREPDLQVTSATAEVSGGTGALLLETENRGPAGKLAAELMLRDGWSRLLKRQVSDVEAAAGKGQMRVAFDAHALPGGTSFVEFRLLNSVGVVEFGAVAVAAPAPQVAVKLTKYNYEENEAAEAVVSVKGTMPEGAALVLKSEDHFGRVLWERRLGADETDKAARVELPGLLTPGFVARVVAVKDGRALAEADCRGLRRMPTRYDDWLLGLEMYGGASASWNDGLHDEFMKLGFRLAHTNIRYTNGVASMRNAGMKAGDISGFMPNFRIGNYNEIKQNYAKTGDLKWLERNPSPNDPAYRAKTAGLIKNLTPFLRAYGIWDNTLIDELSLTHFSDAFDFSFDKHTLAKFREWAKTQYKDLAELNASYGAQFATWEDVRPSTWTEAQQRGKFAGWADHRRFMELSLVDYFQFVRAEVQKHDPDARISLSGTQAPGPYNGHDVWLRCKTFDGLWPYMGYEQPIMHREWGRRRKPGWFEFTWRGWADMGPRVDAGYWSSALNQNDGAAYWWFLTVLNPDWRASKTGEWTERSTRELREGVGKLIRGAELTVAPVALHYSQASCRGGVARGAGTVWPGTRRAWSDMLLGLGLQYTFLSYEQLETGELTFPKTRVLILPYSIAMSEAEVKAAREFVKAGGCLIADMQTAVMDEHCRERNEGALDDVFGLKRMDGGMGHVAGDPKLNAPAWGLEGAELRCKLEEPSLTLKGGQAMLTGANTPGVIVNKYGAGRAIYLGFGMARYLDIDPRAGGAPMRQMLAAILREAGVRWPVTVREGKDELSSPDVDVFHYAVGDQEFVGLHPGRAKDDAKLTVTVSLASPRVARELRSGRDLGRVSQFDVELTAPYTQFFSLLPSAVKSVSAEAPDKVKLGQPVKVLLSVATEDGKPGARVARVTVSDPAGQRVLRWESNEALADGRGAVTLHLALNDPAGKYVVKVRDVASGVTCERAFVAEPAERLSREGEAEKYPPVIPSKDATWRPAPRSRPDFSPLGVDEKPMDFARGILKNARLLESDAKTNGLKSWRGQRTPPDSGPLALSECMTFVEDKDVLFRGAPTTRIDFRKVGGQWMLSQSLDIKAAGIAGKRIRATFHVLRADGPEAAVSADILLRLRPWKDGAVLGNPANIDVGAPLGVWMTGTCELDVDATLDRLDVQLFGKKCDTLYLDGFMLEVVKKP